MQNKHVIALRALRKSSHLSNRALRKGVHFLDRVEHKTSSMIINKAGSHTGADSVPIASLLHNVFPHLAPIHPALPNVGQKPSVTVFVPSLGSRGFYGGIATLLIVSAGLANKLGYDYRVIQTSGFEKNQTVLKFLANNGIIIEKERFSTLDVSYRYPEKHAYLPLHKDDVVVVSAWWDAHTASQLPLSKKFIYMVQDYEPIFYSNSDSLVLAEQTYHTKKFIPLCNTELLYSFFSEKGGYEYIKENAFWFEPAVGKQALRSDKQKPRRTRKMFLYGRPAVTRNLFFSAVEAIDIAMQDDAFAHDKWEIFCAGQSDIPSVKLSSRHIIRNLGKMNLDDYYKFARTIDITVSPMLAPHPNYPTLELASLGSMVVTTKYETKQNLDRYCKNILLAEPTAEDIARYIVKAAQTSKETREKNLESANIGNSWTENLEEPLSKLADILR